MALSSNTASQLARFKRLGCNGNLSGSIGMVISVKAYGPITFQYVMML